MDNQPQPTEDFDHLSPAELSSLAQMIREQIEYCEREVKRLECVRRKLIRQQAKGNRNGQSSL